MPYTQADLLDAQRRVVDGERRVEDHRARIMRLAAKMLPTDRALLELGRLHKALEDMRSYRDDIAVELDRAILRDGAVPKLLEYDGKTRIRSIPSNSVPEPAE